MSPLLAFYMAARGMSGWERSAARDMEKDAADMLRRGYRVVSTEQHGFPVFGITYFRVTYELVDPPDAG